MWYSDNMENISDKDSEGLVLKSSGTFFQTWINHLAILGFSFYFFQIIVSLSTLKRFL